MGFNKRIAIIGNHDVGLYNFRKELITELIQNGYELTILCPNGDKISKLKDLGCKFIPIDIARHGTNPITDIKLLTKYRKELKKINPGSVLTYTIKPNIYGGFAAASLKIPFFANITGLGSAIQTPGLIQHISIVLYRFSLRKAHVVFFQNAENMNFIMNKISGINGKLLPGSGVNVNDFTLLSQSSNEKFIFLFLARVMKDKGIDEFLLAAEHFHAIRNDIEFHIAGFYDGDYESIIKEKMDSGLIIYHGQVNDVKELFKQVNCVVLPSYHEGMSNVLLEASASGIPVIASDIPGCREIIDDGKSGFVFESKNAKALIKAMNKIISLTPNQLREMGLSGRRKVVKEFDRNIVVSEYMKKIQEVIE
ncbi:glycosyltransferase family 4 protein [Enterococcus hirae]|uniref:glycosyltransferase family 4 protein n=1 Tax=Enterococcus faecium TaxID=1352 RepID=UPI002EA84EDE|nr:glycosyltransferase family 4 protein [Enterococcus hirae]HAP8299427.1 glycosyltransferase family 4 protein [Enterococcus faecium]